MNWSPSVVMEWALAIFMLLLEATFLALVWIAATGRKNWRGINLERLLAEQDGAASFSRFQFLIFTFVVASAYIIAAFAAVKAGATVKDSTGALVAALPRIPESVLGLIGISGGSYLVAKGIEKSGDKPGEGGGEGRWVR